MSARIINGPTVDHLLLSLAAPSQDYPVTFELENGGKLELNVLTVTRESGNGKTFIVEGFITGCPTVTLYYDVRTCQGMIIGGDESLFPVLVIQRENEKRCARQAN